MLVPSPLIVPSELSPVSMLMDFISSIVLTRTPLSESNRLLPPLFSIREVIILKYPPMIQCLPSTHWWSILRDAKNSNLYWVIWALSTFDRTPLIGNVITWNSTEIDLGVAKKFPSFILLGFHKIPKRMATPTTSIPITSQPHHSYRILWVRP